MEKSLPTFLRKKPTRLGGITVGAGTVFLRLTLCAGSGASDFDLEGNVGVDVPVSALRFPAASLSSSSLAVENSSSLPNPRSASSASSPDS